MTLSHALMLIWTLLIGGLFLIVMYDDEELDTQTSLIGMLILTALPWASWFLK